MSMDSHAAGTDISGDSEVWKPQVLDMDLAECRVDGGVELAAREHRCGRVRKV